MNAGSTAAADDYTISPATPITIPAGSLSGEINIAINYDTRDENNETVIVDMGVPVNATQGATIQHTATITDDDAVPVLQYRTTTSTVAESGGSINIEVYTSAISGLAASADYAVTAGSATGGGVDYTLAAGTITVTAGNTSANITVSIAEDVLVEGPEDVTVTLTNPANATLGCEHGPYGDDPGQ